MKFLNCGVLRFIGPDAITLAAEPLGPSKWCEFVLIHKEIGILAALGILNSEKAAGMIFCGELALDGRVKPVAGCLPMAIQARDRGYSDIVLPAANAQEAAVLNTVFPLRGV